MTGNAVQARAMNLAWGDAQAVHSDAMPGGGGGGEAGAPPWSRERGGSSPASHARHPPRQCRLIQYLRPASLPSPAVPQASLVYRRLGYLGITGLLVGRLVRYNWSPRLLSCFLLVLGHPPLHI